MPGSTFLSNGNRYQKVARCRILVDVAQVETALSGLSTAAKNDYVINMLRHEVGHCLGLGHNSASQIMVSSAPAAFWAVPIPVPFTSAGTSAINSYRP